jgi:hypothetical protein
VNELSSIKKLADFPGETFRILKEKEEHEYGQCQVNHPALTGGAFKKIFQTLCVTLNLFQGLFLRDSEPSSE